MASTQVVRDYIFINLSATISESGDPDADCIAEHRGEIVIIDDHGKEVSVGATCALVVDIDGARDAGSSLWDIFDLDARLDGYSQALIDDEGEFKQEVLDATSCGWIDRLLILDRLEISPPHRGRGIGLQVMKLMVKHLGYGVETVVLKAFPLQLETAYIEGRADADARASLEGFVSDPDQAREKLVAYYSKAGFEKLDDSGVMLLR